MAIKISNTTVIDNSRNIVDVPSATFTGTEAIKLPVGTTAQRPASPVVGQLRYNSSIVDTEYYNGTTWIPTSANVALTGNPTAPTPTQGDNDTSIATTAFVNTEIAADAVPASFLTSQIGFRNKIINGNFDIWQRGTSFTPSLGAITYAADRWIVYAVGAAPTFFRSYGFGTFRYSLGWHGLSGNTGVSLVQRIESFNAQSLVGAQTLTLSFRFYADVATTLYYFLQSADEQDAFAAKTIRLSGSVFAGTGWTTFAITYPSPHASLANGIHLEFTFGPCTSGTFALTGVQLEAGAVATPFEHRPIGLELALCQRYFFTPCDDAPTNGVNTTTMGSNCNYSYTAVTAETGFFSHTPIIFPVKMRAAPTITCYGNSQGYWKQNIAGAYTYVPMYGILITPQGFQISGPTLTAGVAAFRQGSFTASAEL